MTLKEAYERVYERRNRRGARSRGPLVLALALLAHLGFLALAVVLSALHLGDAPPRKPVSRPVTLRPISGQQWAANRGKESPNSREAAQSRPQRAEADKPKPKEVVPEGQVVDTPPGNGEQDPSAKYLSESDNKVQKETKAREQTPFYKNAMPRRTATAPQKSPGQDAAEKAQRSGNNGIANDDRPLREPGAQKPVFEIPDVKKRDELALRDKKDGAGSGPEVSNRTESEEVRGNSSRLKIDRGQPGGEQDGSQGKAGQPGVANLVPSMSVLDKINGGAPNDHLEDAEEGEGTFLNTKEWKYSGFFNRVKQSVGQYWDPGGQLRQRDPTGNIYGGRDRYTVLSITLNERGMVKDIFVEKSCGLDFLDLEAVRSFERAQPFPNPPPGLMSSEQIKFSFGFFLEMGGGPRLRLFRQGGG